MELMAAISERIHAVSSWQAGDRKHGPNHGPDLSKSTELLSVFFRQHPTPKTAKKDLPASLAAALSASGPNLEVIARFNDHDNSRPSSPAFSESTFESSSNTYSHSSTHPSSFGPHRKKSEHDFLLFAYLLRFVHREGHVGDLARNGLRTLVEVAMLFPPPLLPLTNLSPEKSSFNNKLPSFGARQATLALAEYLLDSDFAEVLGAGLGALYSLLPGKLLVRPFGAGTASPKSRGTSWDDPALDSSVSGMVLGGMGALGEDDDPEEVQIKKEEEDLRLQALGIGVTDTPEFREGVDGWLKLVEFIQDVLRIAHTIGDSIDLVEEDSEEDDVRQQRLMASALSSSISSSVRSLFLQNVLYPSILECSEGDGSAVAVMSYLDALLIVLEEGTAFEATVMAYLLGEEDVSDLATRTKASQALLSTGSSPIPSKKLQRKKSSALVLIESSAPRVYATSVNNYFNSLGRFSLKDLLVASVYSTSSGTAIAALKLLQTLLTRHDRWGMGLLDVVLDEGATSFPVVLREPPALPSSPNYDSDESEEEDGDSDSDVFVYRDMASSQTTPRPKAPTPQTSRSTIIPLLLGAPLPPTPSFSSRLDSLNALLSLVGSIDPSYRNARAVGGGSEIVSTGFSNYLRDAEAALASDLGFRRGLGAAPELARKAPPLSAQARRRSKLFGATPELSPRDFATAKTGYRHQLEPDSPLVSLLLGSLSHFFSHPPDLNLALTGVLGSLALCPYRSLEGWMLVPSGSNQSELSRLVGRTSPTKGPSSISDDGDDRSIDFSIEELGRMDAITSPSKSYTPSPLPSRTYKSSAGTLFSILSSLAASVSHYRLTIPNFDRYLSERRDGLMFVDNLADALDMDEEEGGNAFAFAVKNLEALRAPELVIPSGGNTSTKRKPDSKFGAFLSPSHRPSSTSQSDAFSTPPHRETLRRQPSSVSLSVSGTTGGPSSPFAAHYKQTGSISVKPIVVKTPTTKFLYSNDDEDDEDEEGEDLVEGGPETPTKRLSPFVSTTTTSTRITTPSSVLSDSTSDASPSAVGRVKTKREAPSEVTLSTILDNVILLEEFIKELAAIVCVRRSLGIDGVRFVVDE